MRRCTTGWLSTCCAPWAIILELVALEVVLRLLVVRQLRLLVGVDLRAGHLQRGFARGALARQLLLQHTAALLARAPQRRQRLGLARQLGRRRVALRLESCVAPRLGRRPLEPQLLHARRAGHVRRQLRAQAFSPHGA